LTGTALETFSVLLVEDNADDEFLTDWVLKKAGITAIAIVRDGREALDFLHGGSAGPGIVPDLVILDLKLPKMDGIEVLRRIRADARTRTLPVLIVSSTEDPGDRSVCRRLGITDFLSKPLKAAALLRALNLIGKG